MNFTKEINIMKMRATKSPRKNQMKAMEEMIRQNAAKVQSKWRKMVTGNEQKRVRDHLREKEEQPRYVKFFDKMGFTFGVMNLLICQYFLLNIPEYFSIWYSFIIPIILASRFYHFRSLNWHYFLIDFCYFVNISTLVNMYLLRFSPLFFKICFIHATGPLTLAIPIWRNSLVFHDYDKIVSVYIHILPCMLYYTLRWYNNNHVNFLGGLTGSGVAVCSTDETLPLDCSLGLKDYAWALLFYVFWQIIYLYKTEILDLEKFNRNPDLLTSLRWMSKDTKNPLAKKVLLGLKRVGIFGKDESYDSTSMKTKMVFVVSQFMITILSCLPSYLVWHSPQGHLIYIGLIFLCSMFNGASFYIEVFSVRYHSHIEKLEQMHRLALEANTVMKQIADWKETAEKNGPDAVLNDKLSITATMTTPVKDQDQQPQQQQQNHSIPKKKKIEEEERHEPIEERPRQQSDDSLGKITNVLQETAAEALKAIDEHTKRLLFEHAEELELDDSSYYSDENSIFDDKNIEKYLYNIEDDEVSLSSSEVDQDNHQSSSLPSEDSPPIGEEK